MALTQTADLAPLFDQGYAVHRDGALAQAEKRYKAVLARDPQHVGALHLLGYLNYQKGRPAQALHYLAQALKQNGHSSDLLSTYGLVLHTLDRFDEALTHYDAALALAPDDADLVNRRGVVCLRLGRAPEALAGFDRVLVREPNHVDALANRGNALVALNRPGEAIACYDAALHLGGESAQLLTNRAHALRRLDRLDEAVADLDRASACDQNFAEAAFERALVQLARGDYAEGWRNYERRWQTGAFAVHRRSFTSPLWTGEQRLTGRTILLHAEQGFGDAIQFVRYAPLVAARGANVVLEVQPELTRLMAGIAGVERIVARGDRLPPFDLHCPLMSLPRAFATCVDTIPAATRYFGVGAAEVAAWAGRLPQGRPRIGVCWAGRSAHSNDSNRSIPLARFAQVWDGVDAEVVSLQYQPSDQERALLQGRGVVDVSAHLHDFADTAALIENLDLVVTVDTAIAHLAGALAVPTLVMLPFATDFRWLRGRADSPWYPTATLFRQPRFAEWQPAIEEVRQHLADALAPPLVAQIAMADAPCNASVRARGNARQGE
jgi:hypothetical protein